MQGRDVSARPAQRAVTVQVALTGVVAAHQAHPSHFRLQGFQQSVQCSGGYPVGDPGIRGRLPLAYRNGV